ncbi:MAG: D-alanyl-D-alanine carboxypeptidase/D-alanyl-D-alanine-endopeptidase [Microbacteriaceae bacterium]
MTDNTERATVRTSGPNFLVLGIVGALVGALSFGGGFFFSPNGSPAPVETAAAREVPESPALAFPVRTCSIMGQASSADLGTVSVYIRDTATDMERFSIPSDATVAMGSVMKVLTAATALTVLGPDGRLTTRVVEGSTPGSVVLIGGGDPTLTVGDGTIYDGAPSIEDLATQTVENYYSRDPEADPITSLVVDVSLFPTDDAWHESWPKSERTDGYMPLITPLMVDGDRSNPERQTSGRSKDPIGNAKDAFVAALQRAGNGDGDIDVTFGSAPRNATPLASVSSQPVSTLVKQMLPDSDNTLAEFLMRASSVKLGLGGTAASIQQTVVNSMGKLGVEFNDGVFNDGSGVSPKNRLNPITVATLMDKVFTDGGIMATIADNLPVAGKSGTLDARFTGANEIARGHVVGKTGQIDGVSALAGRVLGADGSDLIVVVVARGDVTKATRAAIDSLFTAVYTCGNNLSSF